MADNLVSEPHAAGATGVGRCVGGASVKGGGGSVTPSPVPLTPLLPNPSPPPSLPSAVFDTALLVEGHLYQLDRHLQRFLTSAAKANIPLPLGLSLDQMRRTIAETAAASCKMDGALLGARLGAGLGWAGLGWAGLGWAGLVVSPVQWIAAAAVPPAGALHQHPPTERAYPALLLLHSPPPPPHAGHVRYWLTAGRGGFGLSGNECLSSAFYCVVYTKEQEDAKEDGAPRCAAPACRACCATLAGLPCPACVAVLVVL